jgi:hypothetical protein
MTHTDYTAEALKTWTAPLRNTPDGIAYLQLGLLSEVGECYGVLKRILRDKTPMDVAQARFEDELGDVLWYCAALEWEKAQPWFNPEKHNVLWAANHDPDEELAAVLSNATDLDIDTAGDLLERARAKNIAKLRSRAARGVITGEGGNR